MKAFIALLLVSVLALNGQELKTVTLPDSINSKTKCLNKDFLVFSPKKRSGKTPLILFLHGMGERGSDVNKIKKHGPTKFLQKNNDFNFIVVSPQCTKDEKGKGWWNSNDLTLLLDFIKKKYNIDEKRIYLTGLSMGGFGSWALAAHTPKTFAAVAPICGGGSPNNAKKYGKLPIWAFHGDKDTVVKLEKSKVMVDAVKKAGGNAKLTIYPGVKHNSWTQTYNNAELYKWFLSHSR